MKKTPKKFEFDNKCSHTNVIDCMECEHYYTGACDGRAGGCDDYAPTRKITMDADIRTIKNLCWGIWSITVANALAIVTFCVSILISSL